MAEEKDSSEKSHEPTEHKLRKAREEGNIPISHDVNFFLSLFSYNLLFLLIFYLFSHIYGSIRPFIEKFYEIDISSKGGITFVATYLFRKVFLLLIAIAFLLTCSSVVGTFLQTKLNVTTKKLKFKFSNISIKNGIKKIFSIKSLIEFSKNLFKTTVFCIAIYYILKDYLKEIHHYICLTLIDQIYKSGALISKILVIFTIIILVFAILDFYMKRFMHMKDMKMSFQELKDEQKESEVDPHVKSKLRQIRMERSKQRVAAAVKESTFVVTNPTHFAVALKYDLNQDLAPIVTAKGADFMAQAIKAVARENNVPIFENKPLARSLYATTEVGDEIPESEYIAVAEIIRKVMNLG